MQTARKTATHTIAPVECGAIFVSLELSRSFWLVTALATPVGSKMSRHQVRGGDMSGLSPQLMLWTALPPARKCHGSGRR